MTDKEKIRAEIERLHNQSLADEKRQADRGLERAANVSYGKSKACKDILSFLDTLEVREIDLDKVFNEEYSKFSNDTDAMDYAFPIDLADFKDFAKHFFELGISISNKEQK